MKELNESKEFIIECIKEFDEKEGLITVETSVHKDDIEEFKEFVAANPSKIGTWALMECSTCVKQHGDGYLHASLEKPSTLEKMRDASNANEILFIE